jgi:NAD+ synthase
MVRRLCPLKNLSIKAFVVGVSGGIDSAVVSTLCAETGLPTYVVSMPLYSSHDTDRSLMIIRKHWKQVFERYQCTFV